MILYWPCIFVHGLHSSMKHLVIDDFFVLLSGAGTNNADMPHIINFKTNTSTGQLTIDNITFSCQLRSVITCQLRFVIPFLTNERLD